MYMFSLCATIALCGTTYSETILDENLLEQMEAVGPKGTVSALVYMEEQVDIKALSDSITEAGMRFVDRHQLVAETLQSTAFTSQESILASLQQLRKKESTLEVTPFWISNVIRIDARPEVILQLSKRSDVGHIFLNY